MMTGKEEKWSDKYDSPSSPLYRTSSTVIGEHVYYLTPQPNDFFIPSWTQLPPLAQQASSNATPVDMFIHS
jgi:hypothetical protein